MKKSLILSSALCMLLLTACGSSQATSDTAPAIGYANGISESRSYSEDTNGYYSDDYSYASDESYASEDYDSADVPSYDAAASDSTAEPNAVSKEMLVYSCTMSVDTLNFETSLSGFRNALDTYGGFVEQENFSDGGSEGRWYSSSEEKWKSYTATVRIPSKDYDNFCNAAGGLGDLRSKNASVTNMSQEYSDLSTTLAIYEAKEARYLALLADITEDEYAIAVEKELTDIQIQIANLKTRMNTIETDVAYSYVYFTLNEVKEYKAEPVKTDTFAERLSSTLSSAGEGFLSFLEWLLFVIIYLAPYLVFLGIVAAVVIFIAKSVKKHKIAKAEKNAAKADEAAQSEEK
ncbi:MAG: DUF4349 domain-containing protein [Oscillospiraceae bacterium]